MRSSISIIIFTLIGLLIAGTATFVVMYIVYIIETAANVEESALIWNIIAGVILLIVFIGIWGQILLKQKGKKSKFNRFFKRITLVS